MILLIPNPRPNFKAKPAQPSDAEKDAVKRVTAYLVRKAKDRHYDQSVIHTYDGNIELRTDDLKSLIKAAMQADREGS